MKSRLDRFIILSLFSALLLASTIAQATVILKVVDVEKQVLRVEYQIEITATSFDTKKYFTFPDDGFSFADDTLSVIQVKNLLSGQDLRWSLVPAKNDPNSKMLQISYQIPTTQEKMKKFTVDIVVEGHSKNIAINNDGSFVINYETSHETLFFVPLGYRIVGANERVNLSESEEGVIATTRGGERSRLKFLIRPCK